MTTSSRKPVPVIFDCDPGIDDAVALLMAMAAPQDIDLLGVTTVVGNTRLEHINHNARQICELAGRPEIPVFAGCPRPLLSWTNYHPNSSEAFSYIPGIHGETGLGELTLPTPSTPLQSQHAVNFIIKRLSHTEVPLTLLATGPLTNIATAITMAPHILKNIERMIIMGGVMGIGNITPAAEYNFFVDPHAAHVVLDSGLPFTLIPLDVTRHITVTSEVTDTLKNGEKPWANNITKLVNNRPQQHFEPGLKHNVLHDPTVVAYLLNPELFETKKCHISVDSSEGPNLGRTTVDFFDKTSCTPNGEIAHTVNVKGFFQLMYELLA